MSIWAEVAGAVLAAAAGCGPSAQRMWEERVEAVGEVSGFARLGGEERLYVSTTDPRGGDEDYNHFVRPGSEPGWVVLAEFQGPGVLDRFWTTGMDEGYRMRMYADGAEKPLLEGAVEELWGGEREPWTYPLSECLNQCWWSYVPIPFAKELRIEGQLPPVHKYWGQRRVFVQAEGRKVAKGKAVAPPVEKGIGEKVLAKVKAALEDSMRADEGLGVEGATGVEIAPGADATVWEGEGEGVLEGWAVSVEPAGDAGARERQSLLQDVVLEVRYGGMEKASVSAPLGDFFCNGWRKRNFACLAMRSGDGVYECRLPTRVDRGTQIRLLNRSGMAVEARFRAGAVREAGADEGYLHAEWNKSGPGPGGPHKLLEAWGCGKYVGCYLGETSLDGSWWLLEGDETIEADGKRRTGTGMEDYFNGGWYYRGCSFTPWSGILDREPFRVGQYRFHLTDAVPFWKCFSMEVERGGRNVSRGWIRSVAYFYLDHPEGVPDASARGDRTAEANPLAEESLMVRLFELERARDWGACLAELDEWLEVHGDAPEAGVLRLRRVETERMADPEGFAARLAAVEDPYARFLAGEEGEEAKAEAELLAKFYASEDVYLVGCCNHAAARVAVDGKTAENRAHPLRLFVAAVELGAGKHVLEVTAAPRAGEPSPWVQTGIRGKRGVVAAVGPGSDVTRGDGRRQKVGPRDVLRGPPHDEAFMGAVPNAFVLLQSDVYGVRAMDWDAEMDKCVFSAEFETSGGALVSGRGVTGLPGPR